jgi:hypothetical protein
LRDKAESKGKRRRMSMSKTNKEERVASEVQRKRVTKQ